MASLVKTPNKHITLTFPDVQQQTGGVDCGLFVLAFAYTLCDGGIPEKMTYKQHALRSHFRDCLIKKKITTFPADPITKFSSKPLLKTFKVYCLCRLLDFGDGMIKCCQCLERFHWSCVQVDEDTLPSKWYCAICAEDSSMS